MENMLVCAICNKIVFKKNIGISDVINVKKIG